MSATGHQSHHPVTVDERSKLVRDGELQITPEGTIDESSTAVQSGEVIVRKDGQVDERSKAVKRGEPEQVEVAVALIEGRDVFAILPTGFGKSLCYAACLPVAFDQFSPLVAIMRDQVSTYSIKGLKTTYASGEVTDKSVLDEVSQRNFQLVFFTPEMLIGSKRWRNMLTGDLYSERLKAFVIDEAHCVKKWMHQTSQNSGCVTCSPA
ncbi:hypothetical protein EMCRGX_G009400 [Ephydatia muelleri]